MDRVQQERLSKMEQRACRAAVLGEGGNQATLPPLPVFRPACWAASLLLSQLALVPRLVTLLRVNKPGRLQRVMSDTTSLSSLVSSRMQDD